jgi:peptidoglycan/xylan/chitin deacetylase (PgdA/CDA1 family)
MEDASPNGQTPVSWGTDSWGSKIVSFVYPAPGNNSLASAKIDITQFTDGDAKWVFSDIPVTPGSTYSFSDTFQSNVFSQWTIRYQMTDNSYSYQDLAKLDPSPNWKTLEKTFTVPSGVRSVTIFHLINSVGWLSIDNVSLVKAPDAIRFTQGMVSIDFDDGLQSAFYNAFPILNTAGLKSTNYLISRYIIDNYLTYLTPAQALQLQSWGHEVGSHTRNHPHLPTLSEALITSEISGSRTDLLGIGFNSIDSFAYPYGEYNDLTDAIIKSTGYLAARTVDDGYNYKDSNKYLLKSKLVEITTSVAEVKSWIDTAVADKTWLILVFHEVDSSGVQYSISPANFQLIVDYLKQINVPVVTSKQGVQIMAL